MGLLTVTILLLAFVEVRVVDCGTASAQCNFIVAGSRSLLTNMPRLQAAISLPRPASKCNVLLSDTDLRTSVLASSWKELRDLVPEHAAGAADTPPLSIRLDPAAVYVADSTIKLHDGVSILGGACGDDSVPVDGAATPRARIACTGSAEQPAFNVTIR
jgi:hypothetical protein